MNQIPIQAIPNQSFTINLDNALYDISIKYTNGCMSVSISRDNSALIENLRAVAGQLIIPCKYQEAGNFLFTTLNQQLPDYTQFNVTQQLIYLSADELAAIRTPTPSQITDDFFNPIAAFPLRYKPQGYVLAP